MISYRCPICKEKLVLEERSYRCINNHTFDIGKQGYINLHIKNKKNSGDDKEMIKSRRDFLEKGYYDEIAKKVTEVVDKYLNQKKPPYKIIDIGCGEGYYTNYIKNKIENKSDIVALDISKEGVVLGAKKYKNLQWVVGSAMDLPFKDNEFDMALCMFSKIGSEEFSRTLKDDGHLIVVSTGDNHLLELKEIVYEKVKIDSYDPSDDIRDKFALIDKVEVRDRIKVTSKNDIENLFNMTPYKWKSPKGGVERLLSKEDLEIQIDVVIRVYKGV